VMVNTRQSQLTKTSFMEWWSLANGRGSGRLRRLASAGSSCGW